MQIKVAITDDHPLAINGLQNMLLPDTGILVSGTYSSGQALLEGLAIDQPDVLLLDILLPDNKGPELASKVAKEYPSVRILVITSLDAPSQVKAMMRHGCKGYLLKNTDQQTLLYAIKEIYKGNEFIEPIIKEQIMQHMLHFQRTTTPKSPILSSREKEILKLIAEENTNQDIAKKLFLSLRTVQNHRFNLQQKLNVNSPVALIKIAIQMGILE